VKLSPAEIPETADADPRTKLLIRILAELDRARRDYALIHADPNGWPDVSSDVDIAFADPPPLVLEAFLRQLAEAGELLLVQALHYEVPHGYYYVLQLPGNLFLHLDCLFDPVGINRYHLPTTFLLEGAAQGPYGRRVSTQRQAIYLLMKRAIKGRVSEHGLKVLHDHFRAASPALWSDVRQWFGAGARAEVDALLRVAQPGQAEPHLAALARAADTVARWQHPGRALRATIASAVRKLRRFVQPTGLFVVIVGPDGSGKSTVTGLVLAQLERAFRRTWRFHWRPGLLPKLRRGGAQEDSGAQTPPQPAEVSKYRGAVSLARFLYYWLDFVIGYWLVVYPRKAQTTLVIGERYFPDVMVHPQRYGFDVPRWLMRLAARLVPSPDLLVVLKDDPQVIYDRKTELPVQTIARQLRAYEEEAEYWKAHQIVETTGGAQSVAARVASLVAGACAYRTRLRLEGRGAGDRWRAFPSTRNTKVWFDEQQSLASALELYHPYSMLGRWAKAMSKVLPLDSSTLLFWGRPGYVIAQRLRRLTQFIRRLLQDETLLISYSMGSAGPHHKLTARVSRGDTAISYVKIGDDAIVKQLLTDEANLLSWLRHEQFDAAEIPLMQALEHCNGDTLLFVGPPPEAAGDQRPYAADYNDVRFLLALDALEPGHASIAEVFAGLRLDAYTQSLAESAPDIAALVRDAMRAVQDALADKGVRVCVCHGDFAPWNTLGVTDGRMFVFDWEYGGRGGVALGDMFQRVFAPPRLIMHEDAAAATRRLLECANHALFGKVVQQSGVAHADLPAYVLLYLLDQLAMRPNDLSGPDPYLAAALRYALANINH
jgi:thymidylate kinase